MVTLNNNIVESILLHFHKNDPRFYLIHDTVEINGMEKDISKKYIAILCESGYLQGFFVEIGENYGKYAIGGLSAIGKEAVRQHFLGNKIDIHRNY